MSLMCVNQECGRCPTFAEHAELTKQHAAKVLNHVADSAKAAGVPCQTVQVEA